MTTQQIADRLVELCRQNKSKEAYLELFAENAVAIEMDHPDNPNPRTEGRDALIKKSEQFDEMMQELHELSVSDPIVAGNYVSVSMTLDATFQGRGRTREEEICLYKVEDGKIVSEQFFY